MKDEKPSKVVSESAVAVQQSMSYEDACALAHWLWSPERIREAISSDSMETLREENRKRLASVGWTSTGLCDEAQRRMHAYIEKKKEEEMDRRIG